MEWAPSWTQEKYASVRCILANCRFQVLIIISGVHKAYALHKAIEDGVSHMWTVSAFQMHSNAMFVADEDATLELKGHKHGDLARSLTVDFSENCEVLQRTNGNALQAGG